jgi:holo-[acyl-carrier protein] synthase
MIVGLGTDLVGVSRIAGVFTRHGEHFLTRVYTSAERDYCLAARQPEERLAARWAAKEACMKALGTGWAKGVGFLDIALLADDQGVPRLVLSGEARRVAMHLGAARWHCSVSHSDGFAVATVILEAIAPNDRRIDPPRTDGDHGTMVEQ